MEEKEHIISKIFIKLVYIVSAMVFSLLFLLSIFGDVYLNAREGMYYIKDNVYINLLLLLGVLLLGSWVVHKKGIDFWPEISDRFLVIFTYIYVGMMLLFVLTMQTIPRADQLDCMEAARSLMQGDFSMWEKGGYMDWYPYQAVWVLFLALQFLVFGKMNWLPLQFWNLGALLFCAKYLSKSAEVIFDSKKLGKYIYFIALLFFPLNGYVTFVYGTLTGLAISLCGCYQILLYLKAKDTKKGILGVTLLVIGYEFKIQYLMFLLPSLLLIFVDYVIAGNKRRLATLIGGIAITVTVMMGIPFGMEQITGIEKGGIPFTANALMGLSEGPLGYGMYSGLNVGIYEAADCDVIKANELAITFLEERICELSKNPSYALEFFCKKIAGEWNEATFEGIWMNIYIPKEDHSRLTRFFMYDGYAGSAFLKKIAGFGLLLIWFGMLLYLIYEKRRRLDSCLFPVILLAGFVLHLILEAKPQYTVLYVYLMLPYMIWGYQKAFQALACIWQNGKKSGKEKKLPKVWIPIGAIIGMVLCINWIPAKIFDHTVRLSYREDAYEIYLQEAKKADEQGRMIEYLNEVLIEMVQNESMNHK